MRYVYLFVLTLAGCSTLWHSPTGAELERQNEELRAERGRQGAAKGAEVVRTYGPMCEAVGYSKDTEAWRACILQRYDERRRCEYSGTNLTCN